MKNIFIILISILLFSCSSNTQVNDESPYAIQIKEVRSIFKAEDVVKRLDKFDINSYIIAEEGDDGTWYRIISGAEKSLDKIQKHKDWLDEKADFKELKIINYQNIKSNLVEDYRESKKEQERIKTLKPDIPEPTTAIFI